MSENEVGDAIMDAAIRVHRGLGPGLLESAYEACLFHALDGCGLKVVRQIEMPVHFEGVKIDAGYRMDLLVEGKVVVELKAVEALRPVHTAQLLSYLRLGGIQIGLPAQF